MPDKVLRTNPAYAELAYRKALVGELITLLRTEYTSAYEESPRKKIICEDVLREDSIVPEQHIVQYLEGLSQEEESLRLELLKFEFIRRENDQPKTTSHAGSHGAKGQGKQSQRQEQRQPHRKSE